MTELTYEVAWMEYCSSLYDEVQPSTVVLHQRDAIAVELVAVGSSVERNINGCVVRWRHDRRARRYPTCIVNNTIHTVAAQRRKYWVGIRKHGRGRRRRGMGWPIPPRRFGGSNSDKYLIKENVLLSRIIGKFDDKISCHGNAWSDWSQKDQIRNVRSNTYHMVNIWWQSVNYILR